MGYILVILFPIKLIINILSSLCFSAICLAQNYADKDYYLIDSLVLENVSETERTNLEASLEVFHQAKDDTSKLNALSPFIQNSFDDNLWPKYNMWSLHFAQEKLNNKNTPQENVALKKHLASAYNNLGQVFQLQGKLLTALNTFNHSLKICQQINNKNGMAITYNNIAIIYKGQGDYDKALDYFFRGLNILEGLNNIREIPTTLNNIGKIYSVSNDLDNALNYTNRALRISKETNNKNSEGYSLNAIGEILIKQNRDEEGLEYLLKGLTIHEDLGDKVWIGISLNNLSKYYLRNNKLEKAEEYAKRNLNISSELGFPASIELASNSLYNIYAKQKKYKEALEMCVLMTEMRDSLNSISIKKMIIEEQEKNKYSNKIAIQKAEHEKQKEIDHLQNQKERTILIVCFIFIMIVAGFIFYKNHTRLNSERLLLMKEIELLKESALSQVVIPGKKESDLELNKEAIENYIKIKLNATDWSILNILYQNPVTSNQELADKVSLSIDGVSSSLKKMYLHFGLVDTKRSQKKLELIVTASRLSNTYSND